MKEQYPDINNDLIRQCLKGDAKSQYRVFKLYAKPMYNICLRFISNNEDAEDILQEAFISAFTGSNKFRGESTFGAWLKRIVINKCLNFIKKKKVRFLMLDTNEIAEIKEYVDEDISELDPGLINKAILDLPEGARIVFNLFVLEDLSHKQIAETLEISESTSKSQYHRARVLLREKLIPKVYERQT